MDEKEIQQRLKEIAYYLEGVKHGRGDILPLGEYHLKAIYNAITAIGLTEKPSND